MKGIRAELKGRKGRNTTEDVEFLIEDGILKLIPASENIVFMKQTLCHCWGNYSNVRDAHYKTVELSPDASGSVLPEAKRLLLELKEKIRKGLDAKVYKPLSIE